MTCRLCVGRIFFLKDGTNSTREVAKLRNISQVEKLQIHSFLNVVDALGLSDRGTCTFSLLLSSPRV